MKVLKLSLVAGVLAAAATPALASESDVAFNSFKKACGVTAADYTAVLAAADTDGWANSQVMGDTMPKVSITDKAARGKTVGATNLILFASRGLANTPTGAVTVSDCTLRTDQGDLGQLVALSQAWLGVPAASSAGDRSTFRFTSDGGVIKAATDVDAAVAGSGLQILTVSRGGGGALTLDLLKLKK